MRGYMLLLLTTLVFGCFGPVQAAEVAEQAPAETVPAEDQQRVLQLSPQEAFALTAAAAEKGEPQAMINMGSLYERGIGTPRNFAKALEWYRKAGEAGSPIGYYNVAVCYEIGMGTSPDTGAMIQNLEKAADMGLGMAAFKLATVYATPPLKDDVKSLAWLQKASALKYHLADNTLGVVYLEGLLGQKKDPKLALQSFVAAAENGSVEAMKNVAVMFKDGLGQAEDPYKAVKWYVIARKAGFPEEQVKPLEDELRGKLTKAQLAKVNAEAEGWLQAQMEKNSVSASVN